MTKTDYGVVYQILTILLYEVSGTDIIVRGATAVRGTWGLRKTTAHRLWLAVLHHIAVSIHTWGTRRWTQDVPSIHRNWRVGCPPQLVSYSRCMLYKRLVCAELLRAALDSPASKGGTRCWPCKCVYRILLFFGVCTWSRRTTHCLRSGVCLPSP